MFWAWTQELRPRWFLSRCRKLPTCFKLQAPTRLRNQGCVRQRPARASGVKLKSAVSDLGLGIRVLSS